MWQRLHELLLAINSNGKNMSPVKIESMVKNAGTLVGQIIAIGDSRPYISALILLDPEGPDVFRHQHGLPADTPVADLATDLRLVAAVQAQIDAANANLAPVEQIRRWTVLTDDWMPGGDELTPTMKLKRRDVMAEYADTVEALYR